MHFSGRHFLDSRLRGNDQKTIVIEHFHLVLGPKAHEYWLNRAFQNSQVVNITFCATGGFSASAFFVQYSCGIISLKWYRRKDTAGQTPGETLSIGQIISDAVLLFGCWIAIRLGKSTPGRQDSQGARISEMYLMIKAE